MKRKYDLVYLTNTPSFYKLNLCEAIVQRGKSVLIVLYGYGSEAVNTELSDQNRWSFDFEFINEGDANKRDYKKTFWNLLKLMRCIEAKKVLYAGWLAPEYNLYSFISPREKNVIVCESSEIDVDFSGIKGWIKKKVIGRMCAALPSGQPHDRLFENIGFSGRRNITGSVGIFHKPKREIKKTHFNPLKFLYVGRLVDVKNLLLLIDTFNSNGLPLTIVGQGILENELKSKAKSNITFTGFIDNNKLGEVYQSHDIFILPSKYEPWGLVVEEAIYWGLPVIVSNKVGSAEDMVKGLSTGCIFDIDNPKGLNKAIDDITDNYNKYKSAVEAVDWGLRDKNQVDAYIKLIK